MSATAPIEVHLFVYRRLDNRIEGSGDDSPRALELHNRRRKALHEALDGIKAWKVTDWGVTDDASPHELAEIIIAVSSIPHLHAAVASAAAWAGLELIKASLGSFAAEAVKSLLARLIPKQKEEKILDFSIRLPDGTEIRCDASAKLAISPPPSRPEAASPP